MCASLNMDAEKKFLLDKIILCSFASFFILIQVIFGISILKARNRIMEIKKEDKNFITELDPKYLEEDYDE